MSTFATRANLINGWRLSGPNVAHWSAPFCEFRPAYQDAYHSRCISEKNVSYHSLPVSWGRLSILAHQKEVRERRAEAFDVNVSGKPAQPSKVGGFKNLQ